MSVNKPYGRTTDRTKRKTWTYTEAEGFLHFYKARKLEFSSARKKRKAYYNVLKDMIAAGITGPETTVSHLEVKMTTLQRIYRALKVDPTTVENPAPCMLQMHEIFGEERAISENSFNIGVSAAESDSIFDDFEDTKVQDNWDSFSADEQIKMEPEDVSDDALSNLLVKSEDNSEDTTLNPNPKPSQSPPPLHQTTSQQFKKGRMNKARYLEEKLLLKVKSEEQKNERWEQFKALEEKKINLLKKLLENLKK